MSLRVPQGDLRNSLRALCPSRAVGRPLSQCMSCVCDCPRGATCHPFPTPISLLPCLRRLRNEGTSLCFRVPFYDRGYKCYGLFSLRAGHARCVTACLSALRERTRRLSPLATKLAFSDFTVNNNAPLLLAIPRLRRLVTATTLFNIRPSRTFASMRASPRCTSHPHLGILGGTKMSHMDVNVRDFRSRRLGTVGEHPQRGAVCRTLSSVHRVSFPCFGVSLVCNVGKRAMRDFLCSLRRTLQFRPGRLFVCPLCMHRNANVARQRPSSIYFQVCHTTYGLLRTGNFLRASVQHFVRRPSASTRISYNSRMVLSYKSNKHDCLNSLRCTAQCAIYRRYVTHRVSRCVTAASFAMTHGKFVLSTGRRRRHFVVGGLVCCVKVSGTRCAQHFKRPLSEAPLFHRLTRRC